MRTTLLLERANSPACFNETLDRLGRLGGVHVVHGSASSPCVDVDHDGIAADVLPAIVRDCRQGDEIRMVPLEPSAGQGPCPHHR